LVVDQQGVDVVVAVSRPDGPVLFKADSPNRSWGPEEIWWLAPAAPADGRWRVEIRPWQPAPQGRYTVRVVSSGPPGPGDTLRAAAWQAIGRAQSQAGRDRAAAELAKARELWRQAGEPLQVALVDLRLADVRGGEPARAAATYREALGAVRGTADPRLEIFTLLRLGDALRLAGDLGGAWQAQDAALQLAHRQGFADDEAAALNNQGLILQVRGEIRAALDRYRRAVTVFQRLGERSQAADALDNLGVCARSLGLFAQAAECFQSSVRLRRELGNLRGEAASLTELGWVYHLRALVDGGGADDADREQARTLLEEALELRRKARDPLGEAGTLDRLGSVYRDAGRWSDALSCYRRSLHLLRGEPAGRDFTNSLTNLAELWLDWGHPAAARRYAANALARSSALPVRDHDVKEAEIHLLYLLGRADAALGNLDGARRELDEALRALEELRAGLGDQTLTMPFFALRQLYFEGAVEALMDLDTRHPGQGFAAVALETSERARMRTLLDSLVARRHPGRGEELAPLTAEQIERNLLDDDTVLLDFTLGKERSFLWVVSRGSLTSHPLPGRSTLVPLVSKVYRSLSSRAGGDPAAARRLAGILLGPAADRLEGKRLAVVTDGLLAYIPFGALPWGSDGQPLLARHEIVRLPSATALAALRRRAAEQPAPTGKAVVLADPVFSSWDGRVHHPGPPPAAPEPSDHDELTRAVRGVGLEDLSRLPASRDEARAIAALDPDHLVALDFSADRQLLDTPAVRNARILHLATHSLMNPRDPDLSGIVLSLVDKEGHPRQGFLRAEEIAALDLRADLVVLSACKTALGPEVRGEGLLGLSRAFLRAGAERVIVSLWSVEDRSSAALMTRFYQGLLRDRLPPAEALRRAQLAIRRIPGWEAPYYWAGFELQGDWR
jgi:CHAT domain-containing protein